MAAPIDNNTFLVEIRLGRTKWRIKKTTAEIGRIFHIEEFIEKHPHITLFGPFCLKKGTFLAQFKKTVETAVQPFGPVQFLLHGYDMNQGLNGAVIAYRVVPTDTLVDLTEAIVTAVGELAETFNVWDRDLDHKWYHVTIANRLDREKGAEIFSKLTMHPAPLPGRSGRTGGFFKHIRLPLGLAGKGSNNRHPRPPLLDEDGLRITIVNGENILAEYDLLARCWYTHEGQKFPHDWQQTLRQFRKTTGIELTKPQYSSEREIFVISDLHLGHGNIIKYCSRPFPHDAVDEMDQMLIRNWNYTVKPDDRIYHIGDLCYGPLARNLYEYLQRLNGQVTLIQGNHDERERAPVHSEPMVHKDIPFLLVHDPDDAPVPFEGWVIHGHHHNNDLENYPFINFEKRRINVSAELVRYQPVPLAELCNIIKDHQIRPYVKSMLLREAEQEQKPYTTYLQRKHSSPDTG